MNALPLILALFGPIDYSAGREDAVASIDYAAGRQRIETQKPPLVEEDDESPVADPLRVVVYVDLSDVAGLRKLLAECDRLPGLKIEYRDQSKVPVSGKSIGLPLAHYHTDAGWKFVRWSGADSFRKHWLNGNPSQVAKQQARITASRANPSAHYRARSYEWHLTQGESLSALRAHLAVPRVEHHGASFPRAWLDQLSFIEAVGLHSDSHNNRVDWDQVNREPQRSVQPQRTVSSAFTFRRSSGGCPGRRCPRN